MNIAMRKFIELEPFLDPINDPGKRLEEVKRVEQECDAEIARIKQELMSGDLVVVDREKLELELAGYEAALQQALKEEQKLGKQLAAKNN
jgi:hypothetical protein